MTEVPPCGPAVANVAVNVVFRDCAGDGDASLHFRVLHVCHRSGMAWIIGMDGPCARPAARSLAMLEAGMREGVFEVVADPRPATMRRDSELSTAEIAKRNKRFEIIRPIVEDPRRPFLDERNLRDAVRERIAGLAAVGRAGPRGDRVVGLVLAYFRAGQVRNALVPAYKLSGGLGRPRPGSADGVKRGRPKHGLGREGVSEGVNVTSDIAAKLLASAPFLKQPDSTDREAFKLCLERYFSEDVVVDGVRIRKPLPPDKLPTMGQFLYHAKKASGTEERVRGRIGDTAYDQRLRARTGSAADLSFGPGSVYQTDSTLADLMLALFDDARPGHPDQALAGKPFLYLVVDVYSTMITGFSGALSPPSFETLAWAVANSFEDKVAYCASLDIEIESWQWPCRHMANAFVGDRGPELTSRFASAASGALDFASITLPRARPDYKGLVEGKFAFLDSQALKYAPGTWRRRRGGERPDPLDGAMTLRQFQRFMARQIIKHNTTRGVLRPPPDWNGALGRAPTPVELWRHGCATRGLPEPADMRRVLAGLMHSDLARETDRGLKFKGLHYLPDDPDSPLTARFARTSRFRDVEVRYNPAVSSQVFVPVDGGDTLIPCSLGPGPHERRFAEARCTFDEVALWFAAQRADAHVSEPGRRAAAAVQDAHVKVETASAWDAGPVGERRPKRDPEGRKAASRAQRVEKASETFRAAGADPAPAASPARTAGTAPAVFRSSRLAIISAVPTDTPPPPGRGDA